jgi:hypothetical protein
MISGLTFLVIRPVTPVEVNEIKEDLFERFFPASWEILLNNIKNLIDLNLIFLG